jgi:hypothetical protein
MGGGNSDVEMMENPMTAVNEGSKEAKPEKHNKEAKPETGIASYISATRLSEAPAGANVTLFSDMLLRKAGFNRAALHGKWRLVYFLYVLVVTSTVIAMTLWLELAHECDATNLSIVSLATGPDLTAPLFMQPTNHFCGAAILASGTCDQTGVANEQWYCCDLDLVSPSQFCGNSMKSKFNEGCYHNSSKLPQCFDTTMTTSGVDDPTTDDALQLTDAKLVYVLYLRCTPIITAVVLSIQYAIYALIPELILFVFVKLWISKGFMAVTKKEDWLAALGYLD